MPERAVESIESDNLNHWTRWLSPAFLVLILIYFLLVYGSVIYMTEGVNAERDGFFHARYSQLLPERGLSREFRWMQFTSWRDQFCDKDTLYHAYLAPFCRDAIEPLPGAKFGTLLLLIAALGALYFVLTQWKVPARLVWVGFLAVGSAHFLNRMLMVRSHCLSVVLMILSAHVILKRRFWPCVILAFIYAWSYSAPVAMLIAAVALESGRWFIERDFKASVKMPAAVALGLALGLVIHPYSPNSLASMWLILTIAGASASGSPVELGTEFNPLTLDSAFTVSLGTTLISLSAVAGALVLWMGTIKNRKLSSETAGVVALAVAWFVLMLRFERFIEYSAPLGCLAAGFVARDILGPLPPLWKLKDNFRVLAISLCGLAVMLLTGLHAYTSHELTGVAVGQTAKFKKLGGTDKENFKLWYRGRYFDGAAAWMKKSLKPQTTVVNFFWDDFPELFYSAPEMNYLVGLDPTIMRLPYPDKSKAIEDMRTKKIPLSFEKLHELFNADYAVFVKRRAADFDDLKTENARARIVFSDDLAVIYSLK